MIWCLTGLLVATTLAWLAYPDVDFYFQMRHTIRDAPYIAIFVEESGKHFKVADSEAAHRLWGSLTVFGRTPSSYEARKSCSTTSNACLASVGFPIDIGNGKTFDWPIYVYKDGTVL